jgi:hypothetical protein
MNWSSLLLIAALVLSCAVIMQLIERKRWFMGVLFYVAPVLGGMMLWAATTASWPLTLAGWGLGAVFSLVWWLVHGRHLRPAESTIKVWGQDSAPKPKAALQAEIDALKEEKAQLEAELQKLRLKDGR